VIVGDHDTRRVDDETGAQRIDPMRLLRRFLKNSSKNSSKGEPGGSCGVALLRLSTVCEVEMLTTALMTFSATSAMPSGPRAAAGAATSGIATTAAAIASVVERQDRRTKSGRPTMGDVSPGEKLLQTAPPTGATQECAEADPSN
jgi:hypothetical protein